MSGSSRIRAKAGAQQADWLSLVEPRGQFLTLPVLRQSFPQGLSPVPVDTRREVRERARALDPEDPGSTTAWLEWLLTDLLAWGERLRIGPQVPDQLAFTVAEHGVRLRPEYALLDKDGRARVLVERYAPGTRLDARIPGDRWAATPIDRAGVLCRALAVPLALVTNGQHITLVYAPQDKVGGHATWDTSLFAEGAEATLLDAFVELLGARSFFAKAPDSQLDALMARSADAQAELTTTLGLQVRRAVELVVASLSRANLEASGEPLKGIPSHRVYEAASTVVMRLVFLLYAEERHLLPLGEQVYDDNYAISTMLDELQSESDLAGDEPLELRSDAWQRILATTRAVYAGVSHDRLRMPAYHGSLFDPDRFPFLEGRTDDEPWHSHPSRPMRVDDLTIREILRALQVISSSEGGVTEARRLSFRALDVEQIGHVYEGLLDHSALRADTVILGLIGKAGTEPETTLDALEEAAQAGTQSLTDFVVEQTGRTTKQASKLLTAPIDDPLRRGLLTACDNDTALVARLEPFAHLLRDDLRGLPTVFIPGTIYVTETSHRRDTGTEYTPRELAEEIVKYTLEPLVYSPGPQDGAAPEDWKLKSPEEILSLTVCDPAVGSGAILVAACRYLADRLVEARLERDEIPEGYVYDPSVPAESDELIVQARRDVADRCLFGVDRDPMAVEMAKLSLWLTTLSKERPFTFVDHAVQTGDSLLGITSLDQLYALHLDPARGRALNSDLFVDLDAAVKPMVDAALEARGDIEALPGTTVRDIQRKTQLNSDAAAALREASTIADLVVGASLASLGKQHRYDDTLRSLHDRIALALQANGPERSAMFDELQGQAQSLLDLGRPAGATSRRPLHWPLAFPEVMSAGGFAAMVGNPPYIGNKYWKTRMGADFQPHWEQILGRKLGKPDVIVIFAKQMVDLLRHGGHLGVLATQSISEVDSRELMQAVVLDSNTIVRAVSSRSWPGSASVVIAQVWLARTQDFVGPRVLDGKVVEFIGAALSDSEEADPQALDRGLRAFQGVDNSRGLAFVVDSDWLVDQRARSGDLWRPYLSGEDLSENSVGAVNRYVLDLTGWDKDSLSSLPDFEARFLSDVVGPTRRPEDLTSYKGLSSRWWTFWNTRETDYQALRQEPDCVVMPAIAKHLIALEASSEWCFTNKVIVFHQTRSDLQVLLLSYAFDVWYSRWGGTYGTGARTMKIGSVVDTFPVPLEEANARLGREWQSLVASAASPNTALNAMHSPGELDSLGENLRKCQAAIDQEVARVYGWLDLDLSRDFRPTPQGTRWSLGEEVQREALVRLIRLNQARSTHAVDAARASVRNRRQGQGQGQRKTASRDQMTLEMP